MMEPLNQPISLGLVGSVLVMSDAEDSTEALPESRDELRTTRSDGLEPEKNHTKPLGADLPNLELGVRDQRLHLVTLQLLRRYGPCSQQTG